MYVVYSCWKPFYKDYYCLNKVIHCHTHANNCMPYEYETRVACEFRIRYGTALHTVDT